MESNTNDAPLVVVLGPTASGKTALSLMLAQRFNGEIIAADSRTVYKDMDIGTAKPTLAEQHTVPHHLINVVYPDQSFTVSDFQKLANKAISDITAQNRIPFMVGGSGLYIDSILYDFSFRSPSNPPERQRLESLSIDELRAEIDRRSLALPSGERNPRHLIRTLETNGEIPKRTSLRPNTLIIGVSKDKEALRTAIQNRVEAMVGQGFIEEVRVLGNRYGWDISALQAPGYRAFRDYIEGNISLDEAKRRFVQNDVNYAKRQRTWFKRDKNIHWISKSEDAVDLVTTFLNK